MSIQQSYLSKKIDGQKAYNVDMVTAISDKALNSQMRLYLSSCNWDTRVYFLETIDDETGNSILFMLQNGTDETKIPEVFMLSETVTRLHNENSSIFNELEKLNLFGLASGTSIEDSALSKALEYCFSFGLHLADGIPEEVMQYLVLNKGKIDVDEALNIITLDKARKTVLFRQFFKKFEIIQVNVQLKGKKVIGRLNKVAQDCSGENPIEKMWSTRASIGVDFRASSHKDIESEEIRNKIEKMAMVENPDTVFDISQLILDLSTLQTVSPVVIEGVSPEVKGTITGFVQEYFERLEKAGQTIFGYVVLPKPSENINYLFTPVMRNFDISDNVLYYLINLQDNHNYDIPTIGKYNDFEWAPLLDGKVTADGVMAINATKFIPLIRSKMEKLLPNLIMTRHPYVHAGVYKYEVKWDEPAVPMDQHFNVPENAPWTCNWNYSKDYNQDYQLVWAPPLPFPVASGKICSNYKIDCEGNFGTCEIKGVKYPSYDFKFRIKGWMNYGYNSQSNSGDYFDHTVLFQVAIKINANGNIEFLQNVVDKDNNPKGIEIHGWGDFCSLGTLQGAVDDMCENLSDKIKALENEVASTFLEGYNTFTSWFMPGARTFTYKEEGFSDYGDLFTYVNYVQETC